MVVDVSRSRFSLNRGLLISLVVHVLPFAVVFALGHTKLVAQQKRGENLQVELYGLVTGQQVAGEDAQAAEQPPPEAPPEEPAPPEETMAPEEPPQPAPPPDRPQPVRVRAQKKTPVSVAHRQPVAVPSGQQAHEGQVQQTSSSKHDLEASAMRQYLAQLSRIVRNRLVYPVKAKAKGWIGVTQVAFTVTEGGDVVSGSAAVRKTSGYEELDQAALNAVRNAGHLPTPPRQMEVIVAVNFSKSDL